MKSESLNLLESSGPLQGLLYLFCTTQEKHAVMVIKTNQLVLYREVIALCSEIHLKQIKYNVGRMYN
jgi:hypothetical protein